MYVLGSMIQLPSHEIRVPVPWWHRAPLGFEHDTQVFAAITEPTNNRPGEILVSVLDLNHWSQHTRLRYAADDAPGVVEKVLAEVEGWNIALAEAVTVEGGRSHHVDLLCETYRGPKAGDEPGKDSPEDRSPSDGLRIIARYPLPKFQVGLVWSRLARIDHGWIRFDSRASWRAVLTEQLSQMGELDSFDLQKLILTADTENRLFRVFVPRKGAVLASIEHADDPGVLRQLAGAFRHASVNIVSALLKRGGAAPGNAILVVSCEPATPSAAGQLADNIRKQMKALPQELRVDPRINEDGLWPESVVYSRHPDDIVAHVPPQLRARVRELRAEVPPKTMPVFLSRRFLRGKPEHYADKIRDVLRKGGCHVIEAKPLAGGTRTSLNEVSAAMWAAKAGVVLGVAAEDESDVSFSLNLAHEFGYMHGQGKPLLLLIEADSRVERELDDWSNIKGIQAPRFDHEYAFVDDHDDSIAAKVGQWLVSVRSVSGRGDRLQEQSGDAPLR